MFIQTPSPTPSPIVQAESIIAGLNTAAAAGVIVGAVLGVVLILGVAFMLLRRKRRARNKGTRLSDENGSVKAPWELDGRQLPCEIGSGRSKRKRKTPLVEIGPE